MLPFGAGSGQASGGLKFPKSLFFPLYKDGKSPGESK